MNIHNITQETRNKGLLKSNKTNQLKGILRFVKNTTSKADSTHNQIIDELIKSGYYTEIYNKYVYNTTHLRLSWISIILHGHVFFPPTASSDPPT